MCDMTTYFDKLKDPRWQKFKALVHIRDDWTCQDCGAKDRTLVAHHLRYEGNPWDVPLEDVMTLCWDCHGARHGHGYPEEEDEADTIIRVIQEEYGGEIIRNGSEMWIRNSRTIPDYIKRKARVMSDKIFATLGL